jgi:hypothetical protein
MTHLSRTYGECEIIELAQSHSQRLERSTSVCPVTVEADSDSVS